MELTKEQIAIINSTGNIKINAVAGSGKTTTIIEYAKARPRDSKILYLAFNKSVKMEAAKKFAEKGLTNVKVETAHSLAFNYIVKGSNYKLRSQEYKATEITELLKLQGNAEKHTEFVIANHINKFITYFCNSDKLRINDLNYLDVVSDPKAKAFVALFYGYILEKSRELLNLMNDAKVDITHSFYLKKFQLSNPLLNYDYILFDEGQDASSAMLDVFFKQRATKVIVGDTHQQIYGWRYAVNSLEKANFDTFHLSTSFRFSQDIANLAMEILKMKSHLGEHNPIPITGKGISKEETTKAVLARTNLGLLLKAIDYVTKKKEVKHLYFEGNINSYTFADDGTSLYDVLNLYNGKHRLIRDPLIKVMKGIGELEDYIEKTEEVQLGMMVEIVKEYGDEIPEIIKSIKDLHVEKDEKEKAEIIFSTVHRCKGMEYDSIQLAEDFMSEGKLIEILKDNKNKEINTSKLNEEINLLYVAITRTKNRLHIPESLMPFEFPASSQIRLIKTLSKEEKQQAEILKNQSALPSNYKKIDTQNGKAYSIKMARETDEDAYKPWTDKHDKELEEWYCKGLSTGDIAKLAKRTKGAISSRIKKLELRERYG